MSKFQAVGLMMEAEDGLSKEQIMKLLELMPDDETLYPFEASENNSVVYGFMTGNAIDEDHHDAIIEVASELCEDFENERTDKTYTTKTGLPVFIECEAETARGEKAFRSLTSMGEYAKVEVDDGDRKRVFGQVIICPKPYAPWKHLLESSNGDVFEVKTADITMINDVAV